MTSKILESYQPHWLRTAGKLSLKLLFQIPVSENIHSKEVNSSQTDSLMGDREQLGTTG